MLRQSLSNTEASFTRLYGTPKVTSGRWQTKRIRASQKKADR